MVTQPLVTVSHHGAPPIPAPAPDDVHGVHSERIGRAHHRADVRVVAEIFDRDVQPVPAFVDVGDDRITRPIPVCVNDIAGVATTQEIRIVTRVIGWISVPWPHPVPVTPLRRPRQFLLGRRLSHRSPTPA